VTVVSDNGATVIERFWDDVEVDEVIEGFSMDLGWTAMALQVSGSQDWNAIHHDVDYARDSGHAGPFFNTGWTSAMLGRALTDWIGVRGWVCKVQFEMRKMNRQGDAVRVQGRVVGKRIAEGRHLVDVDLWIDNDREGTTTTGQAVVALPRRGT
jgi:acyl dehydratase